jgi:hypothetical protein
MPHGVAVAVGVLVGVSVGVLVGVAVGVFVGVLVGVFVGVFVGVLVGVDVGVLVGVRVGFLHAPFRQTSPGEQQKSPHANSGSSHAHRLRPRLSGVPQAPEQHWLCVAQLTPPSRQPAASLARDQMTVPTGPPMPIAAKAAFPSPLIIDLRDGCAANCFVRRSKRS